MPIAEISVIPLGTRGTSLSRYIASSLKVLEKEKGIDYELTSMGTIIEAKSLRKLLNVAEKMHNKLFSLGVKRVVTTIKIDDRRDKEINLKSKISSVKDKLSQCR